MPRSTEALLFLTQELQRARSLEEMLQLVVDQIAGMLDVHRVTARLLDDTGDRLLTGARSGTPLHAAPISFSRGEGLVGWIVANGRPLRLDDAENDARFAARPGMIDRMGSFLGVPLLDGSSCMGVIAAVHSTRGYFSKDDETLLELAAAMCTPHLQIARLRRLARVDPLTGAVNRRAIEELLPETDTAAADDVTVSVVAADVDHLKVVNDAHGHDVGDEALRAVAKILASSVRAGDTVARPGGEEFLLVLPGANAAAAQRVAERARRAVEAHLVVYRDVTLRITASFGVAERRPGESREALLRRADEAMYAAKRGGRNRVALAE